MDYLPLPRGLMNFVRPTPKTYAGDLDFLPMIAVIVASMHEVLLRKTHLVLEYCGEPRLGKLLTPRIDFEHLCVGENLAPGQHR